MIEASETQILNALEIYLALRESRMQSHAQWTTFRSEQREGTLTRLDAIGKQAEERAQVRAAIAKQFEAQEQLFELLAQVSESRWN